MNQKYNVSKKALNALKASIARWDKAARGNNDDSPSSLTWPLCRLFAHKACDGCPVKQQTGQPYCRETPFKRTVDSWRYKHPGPNEQYLADAQKELAFLKSLLPKPTNNTCSACEFQASLGITLLDAKYLDPKCWTGCQALVHKHRIEALIEAGNKLRQKAALGQHAEFEDLEAWDKAATLEPTTDE